MDSSAKQSFVHVDISESGQERLVQKQRFHACLVAAQARAKVFEADFKRLRPEPGDAARHLLAPLDAAELADVVVKQNPLIEREHGVRILAPGSVQEELASHAEMHGQSSGIERDDDELPAPPDGADGASLNSRGQFAPVARRHEAGVKRRRDDAAPR